VRAPDVRTSGKSTRIRHRELLATVTGSTSFSVFQSIVANPGMAASFPWLSKQAQGWEQYRFHKLKFEYLTRCATSTVGSVILAPDYDSLDAPPNSELQATTYRDAVENVPWQDSHSVLAPAAMFPMGPRKYIRSGLVANSDLKTYDAGVMHICTTGEVGNDAIGKLWVEYDVELFVPQTEGDTAASSQTTSQFNLSTDQSLVSGVRSTIAFDEVVQNAVGITNASGVFTLPKGVWEVHLCARFSGGTAGSQTCVLDIFQDGGVMMPPNSLSYSSTAAGASDAFPITSFGLVTSDGTTTVEGKMTYTSATGSLTATADCARILMRAV
jgi:hypothetical protein